jgi:hypothetical protein
MNEQSNGGQKERKKANHEFCVSMGRGTGVDRGHFEYSVAATQAQLIRGRGMRPKPEMDERGKLGGKMSLKRLQTDRLNFIKRVK